VPGRLPESANLFHRGNMNIAQTLLGVGKRLSLRVGLPKGGFGFMRHDFPLEIAGGRSAEFQL
jgi:hypothetical protein